MAIVVLGLEGRCSFNPLHRTSPPAPAMTSPVINWLLEDDEVWVSPTDVVTVVV
jgi:hypothetical protein